MASLISRWLVRFGLIAMATQTMAQEASTQAELKVGRPQVIETHSSDRKYGAVFEDDGETGYFYALDFSAPGNPIQEAISIYNVAKVIDRDKPSHLAIRWSSDQRKAGLWINDYPHAIFDFSAQRGYSRSNFPSPGKWKSHDFAWSDDALKLFQ